MLKTFIIYKHHFYSNFKKFRLIQSSHPIIEQLNIIYTKKNAKRISTFDFSTLETNILHVLLTNVLS